MAVCWSLSIMLRSLPIPKGCLSESFIGNPVKTLSRIWRYSWYQINSRTSWSSGLRSSWLGGQPLWSSTIQVPITKVPGKCVCVCVFCHCSKYIVRTLFVRPCGLSLSSGNFTLSKFLREEKYHHEEVCQYKWSSELFTLLLVSSGVFVKYFYKVSMYFWLWSGLCDIIGLY